jgi:8-hydroxy-5-deazaflavin:NADPH oxidoreductase
MKITTIGRGNIGGGLARKWRDAGHEVQELGRDGGDASGAEAILLAVPAAAIGDAIGGVSGIGAPVIDATNLIGVERPEGFDSLAEYSKSLTGQPTAKAFNTNFARLYDRLGEARARPSMLYCGDEEAKQVAAQLIEDAGYEPVSTGDLSSAQALEDMIKVNFAVSQEIGPFLYRMAPPEAL